MANLGFLGCGTIGKSMIKHIRKNESHSITFIQARSLQGKEDFNEKIIIKSSEELYRNTDIIIESATAEVLKENIDEILKYSDLIAFSVTAFSDEEFTKKAKELCQKYNRHIYIPHGAILGLDGIFDARSILKSVTIETIKSPQSLGRTDKERTIVYEGITREACKLYPRSVNVHASIALAGIGFDKTISKVVSDPEVTNNTHIIQVEGEGISFTLNLSSFSTGGVTGSYTPISACGSLDRILGGSLYYSFI